jgi:hypothetical protein
MTLSKASLNLLKTFVLFFSFFFPFNRLRTPVMELHPAHEVSHLRVVTPSDGFLQCAGFAETRNQVRHCHASCISSSTSVLQTPFPSPHRPRKELHCCAMLPTPFSSPDKSEELRNCHRHCFKSQFLSIPKTSPLVRLSLIYSLVYLISCVHIHHLTTRYAGTAQTARNLGIISSIIVSLW